MGKSEAAKGISALAIITFRIARLPQGSRVSAGIDRGHGPRRAQSRTHRDYT